MVELNDEDNLKNDDIKTIDGMDFETNKGYILGTPFIRAFMIILDFHQNRIGFANKIKNYGAEITGEGAPSGPVIPPTPIDPVEPIDPVIPDVDPVEPIDPVDPVNPGGDDSHVPDSDKNKTVEDGGEIIDHNPDQES